MPAFVKNKGLMRFVAAIFWALVLVLGIGIVRGQNYPNKTIRIVSTEPGSSADFVARQIALGISDSFGQSVIVDNRGGGGGTIAAELVAKATPDGYTLLFFGQGIWILPLMRDNLPYDPIKDFSPVTLADRSLNVLVVHPTLPVNSVKELIAYAKAKPGEINFATGGTGSSNHLAAELFKAMAGVNIVRINYKGTGPALTALVGGEVQLMFPTAASVTPHVKSGRLKALAVTSAEPSVLAPGLPTVAAVIPGYQSVSIHGLFAPAKTPMTIVRRLNVEIVRLLNRADVKEKLFSSGLQAVGSSPEQLGAAMKSEMARLGKVIKDAGIRND